MRIIPHKTQNHITTINQALHHHNHNSLYVPIDTLKNTEPTKNNVFPHKYVHKHDWLLHGYRTTYKNDFIKLN